MSIKLGESVKVGIPGLPVPLPGVFEVVSVPTEDAPNYLVRSEYDAKYHEASDKAAGLVEVHPGNLFRVCDYCDNGVSAETNVCGGCGYDFTGVYAEDGEI